MSGADGHTEQCRECPHVLDLDQLVSEPTDANCVKVQGGKKEGGGREEGKRRERGGRKEGGRREEGGREEGGRREGGGNGGKKGGRGYENVRVSARGETLKMCNVA